MSIKFPILVERDYGHLGDTPCTIGKLARVSKHTARKLHAQNVPIIIVAHKFMPYTNGTGVAMRMPTATVIAAQSFEGHQYTFDDIVVSYVYHNCNWETGYYPAFWVQFDTYHTYSARGRASERYVGQIG